MIHLEDVQKGGSNETSNYLYDGLSPSANAIERMDGNGAILSRFVQGRTTDEHLGEVASGTVSYYEQDALGTVSSLSNAAAALANSYSYDAFGKPLTSTGTLSNPFQYTGRDFDPETGIDYYRARYYDASIGRFISEDPIRFAGSPSFYVYTQNRPVNATDPSGLRILLCSRGGFQPFDIGNHAYFYDTRNGHSCGRGDQSGKEDPTSPGTVCREVPGSDGHEDSVMRCCENERKDGGSWFPGINDCQTLTEHCLVMNNLNDPGVPGGRTGCRGKCQHNPFPGKR